MHIHNAFHLAHGGADFGEVNAARSAFEKDVEGFADDRPGAPEDHSRDNQREQRVDPVLMREQDGEAADDDGGGGKRVAEHVQEHAADVDVAGELPEQRGDETIHQDAGSGDRHHQLGLDCDGDGEAVDGGNGDPDGEDHE